MTFHRDDRGVLELLNGPQVRGLVDREARAIAADAPSYIPGAGGGIRRSYRTRAAHQSPQGATAMVYTTHIAGHIFEWGSASHVAHGPLRRAVERRRLRLNRAEKP